VSDELAAVWGAVKSLEARQAASEKRQETFMDEVRGHLSRISEDSREGRGDLIESNQAVVSELHSLRVHVDAIVSQGTRDRDAYNRNAQGVASRIGTMEESVKTLNGTVQALTNELLRRRSTDVGIGGEA